MKRHSVSDEFVVSWVSPPTLWIDSPPSATKLAAKYRATPELLRDWSDTTVVPCCAIGGITAQNCGPLVEAGADFLAVIGAVWSHPRGPREAVREFNEVFARYGRAYI